MNAVDQFAPWGSTTYTYREGGEFDGTPESQTINLSPQQQQLFDTQSRIANSVGLSAEGLSYGLPNQPFSLGDVPSGLPVGQALYDRRLSQLQPQLDEIENQNLTMLSDRGIPIGSEVWNLERDRVGRARDEAYSNLARDSILATGQEEDRQLQRKLVERTQGINEIAAALQGSPALPAPSFIAQPNYNIAPPDIQSAVYNSAAMNNQASANAGASMGSAISGIASLAFK